MITTTMIDTQPNKTQPQTTKISNRYQIVIKLPHATQQPQQPQQPHKPQQPHQQQTPTDPQTHTQTPNKTPPLTPTNTH